VAVQPNSADGVVEEQEEKEEEAEKPVGDV